MFVRPVNLALRAALLAAGVIVVVGYSGSSALGSYAPIRPGARPRAHVNGANEYPTIGGNPVSYDPAGNLSVDREGRQYAYDEQNRLIQIKASDDTVLANYTYDGLGRRIVFEDPVVAVTTRYYYDGRSVIEERDAADARVRFHVNGAQFIDERVTTFEDSTGEFTYYLVNQNFSVAGMGNADGSVIDRLDYSSTGDFAGGGPGASSFFHDSDNDLDLDLRDFANFQNCFGRTDPTCLAVHDFDTADVSDGDIDLDDYARFAECFHGLFVTPGHACGIPLRSGAPPPSGTFTLHGRPVDILSDGHALIPIRARYYDAANGRWLQRDPLPYNDGSNLYEPFRGNALRDTDPSGEGVLTWLLVGDYSLSDAQFLRDNGFRTVTTPTFGFFEGAGTASVNIVVGAGRGLKQLGLQVADTAVIIVDIPATLAGFPIDFDPLSQLGQVSATTDDTLGLQLRVGGRAGANIVTLGAFNVVEGTIAFAQTGDAEALSRNVGGQGLIILGTAGIARGTGLLGARATTGARNVVRTRGPASIAESQAARAAALLKEGPGVNITARADALRFRSIVSGGRSGAGTALTDLQAFESILGRLPSTGRITISSQQALALERALGLPTGRLAQGAIISIVEDVALRAPRSPLGGNPLFLGRGRGLPGGGPELNISPISTAGGPGIRQIVVEVR